MVLPVVPPVELELLLGPPVVVLDVPLAPEVDDDALPMELPVELELAAAVDPVTLPVALPVEELADEEVELVPPPQEGSLEQVKAGQQ